MTVVEAVTYSSAQVLDGGSLSFQNKSVGVQSW